MMAAMMNGVAWLPAADMICSRVLPSAAIHWLPSAMYQPKPSAMPATAARITASQFTDVESSILFPLVRCRESVALFVQLWNVLQAAHPADLRPFVRRHRLHRQAGELDER